jgi:hypothetical protein
MSIQFVELPADIEPRRRRAAERWAPVAAELMKAPGKWAIVGTDEYTAVTSSINNGKIGSFPKGQFEARSYKTYRTDSQGGNSKTTRCERTYARYIGEPVPATGAKVTPIAKKPAPAPAPAPRVIPPIDQVARGIARFHAAKKGADWSLMPDAEKGRRQEVALVAFRAVYDLIADDMEKHVVRKREDRK